MNKLTIASNCFNEISQCAGWYDNMIQIADGGILIVDTGSDDGTKEFFEKKIEEGAPVVFITDDIILREGYGNSRNHLREMTRIHYPESHWCFYLDFDERIMQEDFHKLRFLKDYLIPEYDVIALPRLNRLDKDTMATKNDYMVAPDYQARMTRLGSNLSYIRKLHEQIVDYNKMYAQLNNPKIHHFHRSTDQKKRDYIGRLCSKLHAEDEAWGKTYGPHHKEEFYYKQYQEIGLHGEKA